MKKAFRTVFKLTLQGMAVLGVALLGLSALFAVMGDQGASNSLCALGFTLIIGNIGLSPILDKPGTNRFN